MSLNEFGDSAQKLARNPLGIIALFIVLVYGIAALILGSSGTSLDTEQKSVLVWFMAVFPCVVLISFLWLVSRHHTKLYSPSDFRNDAGFLRTLSSDEQKIKLEDEAREAIETVQEINTQIAANAPMSLQVTDIKKSIFLAEELVIRELEKEFATSINRNVSIGTDIELDGMFVKSGAAFGVEIKFMSYSMSPKSIINAINKLSSLSHHSNWKRFSLILAIVVKSEHPNINQNKDLICEIVEKSNIKIDLRFYDFDALQEKYGVK